MNPIQGLGVNGPLPMASAKSVHRDLPQPSTPAAGVAGDRVELSATDALGQAFKQGEIRQDKVAAIRQQLQSGTYDEESKIDPVVDKLLGILG